MEISETDAPLGRNVPDDLILPFQADLAGASGRLVRLGPAVDEILRGHDYPEPVCKLLGEAVALTALLGASLKFEGKFIFQTRTGGPVNMLVVNYRSSGELRGYAGFDAAGVAALENSGEADPAGLLGEGHLAMTVDRGPDMESYQGVVALENSDLNQAADAYFRQSEQLPTFIRVAVARHYSAAKGGDDGAESQWRWRAGGLMLQHLTREGGHGAGEKLHDDDGWRRASILAATVEDAELVDPLLAPERLIYRLFHEEQVRAFKPKPLTFHCGCSAGRVKAMLESFGGDEIKDMTRDGRIRVTCEFCNTRYDFNPRELL
ncbi:33 kDa chaperonin [bacterium BMS3Bbin10]|nr:33 kDa chaperonin [bacterium BMS3Bbin10]HDL17352.1 Hsp33 family molecular chaperone [Hyphomicrobiales bacterium]